MFQADEAAIVNRLSIETIKVGSGNYKSKCVLRRTEISTGFVQCNGVCQVGR